MKIKVILFLTCWFFISLLMLQAQIKKVAVLEEFGQPEGINIGNGYIYIHEKTTIFIYSLKDFKFVKSFGKEGEGPGELKVNPFGAPLGVVPTHEKVYITSMAKLTIFSKSGDYLREYKINPTDSYYPFGDKFVCLSTAPLEEDSQKVVLALFCADENLNKGNVIYKSDFEVGPNFRFDFPITPFYPSVEGDKLFVIAGIHGFAIDVFNMAGEKMYRIQRDYKRLKIPSSYKDNTLNWFKTNPNYKQFFEFFKNRISIKDYYPPIFSMEVDYNSIYVLTNKLQKDQRECIIMDLLGNEKKRVFLPIPEQFGMDFNFHFTISDGNFYKLEENIDEENWELYRMKL